MHCRVLVHRTLTAAAAAVVLTAVTAAPDLGPAALVQLPVGLGPGAGTVLLVLLPQCARSANCLPRKRLVCAYARMCSGRSSVGRKSVLFPTNDLFHVTSSRHPTLRPSGSSPVGYHGGHAPVTHQVPDWDAQCVKGRRCPVYVQPMHLCKRVHIPPFIQFPPSCSPISHPQAVYRMHCLRATILLLHPTPPRPSQADRFSFCYVAAPRLRPTPPPTPSISHRVHSLCAAILLPFSSRITRTPTPSHPPLTGCTACAPRLTAAASRLGMLR